MHPAVEQGGPKLAVNTELVEGIAEGWQSG